LSPSASPYRPALPPLLPVSARPCLSASSLSLSLSLSPSLSLSLSLSFSFSCSPSPPRPLPHLPPSRLHARSLARSNARAHTCRFALDLSLFLPPSLPASLPVSVFLSLLRITPTGSLFLRVTTQWRCHTLAPSSNQCYCFIVPLLLLLLDTRKGDPSIPSSVRERRVTTVRLASRRSEARASSRGGPRAEPRGAMQYEHTPCVPTRARILSLAIHFEINVATVFG